MAARPDPHRLEPAGGAGASRIPATICRTVSPNVSPASAAAASRFCTLCRPTSCVDTSASPSGVRRVNRVPSDEVSSPLAR